MFELDNKFQIERYHRRCSLSCKPEKETLTNSTAPLFKMGKETVKQQDTVTNF